MSDETTTAGRYVHPAAWRDALVALGFTDDGTVLGGEVAWVFPDGGERVARVEVTLSAGFPFTPPKARIVTAGAPMDLSFHRSADDTLCLWEEDWSVDDAPWLSPTDFLKRVAGWLQASAAGWPGDTTCDLERYLPRDDAVMVLYDTTRLAGVTGQTVLAERENGVITLTDQRSRPGKRPHRGKRPRRRREALVRAWVDDIGEVSHALAGWQDIREALGAAAGSVQGQVSSSYLQLLALRYTRHGADGVLVVTVTPGPSGIEVKAVESADTSHGTRWLRAGVAHTQLAATSVCVVGCGAVGSFVADLLFRSGVSHLHLVDPERMRPGNVVRHLAGNRSVGQLKVAAVPRAPGDLLMTSTTSRSPLGGWKRCRRPWTWCAASTSSSTPPAVGWPAACSPRPQARWPCRLALMVLWGRLQGWRGERGSAHQARKVIAVCRVGLSATGGRGRQGRPVAGAAGGAVPARAGP